MSDMMDIWQSMSGQGLPFNCCKAVFRLFDEFSSLDLYYGPAEPAAREVIRLGPVRLESCHNVGPKTAALVLGWAEKVAAWEPDAQFPTPVTVSWAVDTSASCLSGPKPSSSG